jgi:DNA-binding winged helix-turn-helix (wHTH) protein/Tfp pilus assembly protein PilF
MLPTVPSGSSVCFGVFEADLASRELRRKGTKVKIQDLPFRALRLLLSRPNEVLSREEFRATLWPDDVFVDFDRGITSAINRLREALGDSAENPVFIETVGRRGYRWIAPVNIPRDLTPAQYVMPRAADLVAEASPVRNARGRWFYILAAGSVLLIAALSAILFRSYRPSANVNLRTTAPSSLSSSQGFPHHSPDHEAEELYLQGRFYWNKRTPESLSLAVDSFTQAIVHDPNYSDAYVGLADCYNLLREYTVMPASEAYPRALAAAKKAVELDDHSSAAHASLAFVSFYGMWDAATADKEFRRAIDLDPNNANARHWYATYLNTVGRFEESLNEIDRAQALDPDSASILADKGRLLWIARRRDESLRLLRQLAAADPDSLSPHRYLKLAYFEIGDYSGYLAEMKKEALLRHDASLTAIAEAAEKGFAAHGEKGLFESQLAQQKKAYSQGKLSPYFLAQTYARLGNNEEALNYLQICYARHADETVNMATDATFNNLHSVAAFQQLLAKVSLPAL